MDTEINSRICKALSAFQSLSHILWHQHKIQTRTKVRVLNSVILSTLLYGLESSVLLEPFVRCFESFVVRCLWIILGISVKQKKRHTTICKMAKQQRISSLLTQRCLRFLGHLSMQDVRGQATKVASCVCPCWGQVYCQGTEASVE